MRNRVFLEAIHHHHGTCPNDDRTEARFTLQHDNGTTTVEQKMTLQGTALGWSAQLPFNDFPPQKTAGAAALKLAEWMERLAEALRAGSYDTLDLNNLSRKNPGEEPK